MTARLAAVVALALAATACGESSEPVSGPGIGTTVTLDAAAARTSSTIGGAATSSTPPDGSPSPDDASTTTTVGADGAGDGTTYTLPVEVKMQPSGCVEPGALVSVVVTTRKYASIAAAVELSDPDADAPYSIGAADPTGRWRWQFRMPDDAPTGRASLGVSAQDRTPADDGYGAVTTGEEGVDVERFEVRKSC